MSTEATSRQARLDAFEARCRAKGVPLTVQRRTIFEVVLGREDHPTAEQVYEAARQRIPDVSRTTVYRVLDTLVGLDAIIKICHPGAAARFDGKVGQHHHLVCLQCDKVLDLEDEALDAIRLPEVDTLGYNVREFRIHFRGTCPECQHRHLKKKETDVSHGSAPPASTRRAKATRSRGRKKP